MDRDCATNWPTDAVRRRGKLDIRPNIVGAYAVRVGLSYADSSTTESGDASQVAAAGTTADYSYSPWAKSEKVTVWSHEREQRFDISNLFFNL